MARDPDKYLYLEVAFKLAHPSTIAMLAHSQNSGHSPQALVRSAAIEKYLPDENGDVQFSRPKAKKKIATKRQPEESATLSAGAMDTAASFLDGFDM